MLIMKMVLLYYQKINLYTEKKYQGKRLLMMMYLKIFRVIICGKKGSGLATCGCLTMRNKTQVIYITIYKYLLIFIIKEINKLY